MEILVESARVIRQFFREQGYTEESLGSLGLAELPWNGLARQSASAWAVTVDPGLDLLIRLFYLSEAIAKSQAEKCFPKEILGGLLTSELLKRDGEWLQPGCMLTPFGELILACDSWRSAEACAANLVLGVNPTTQLLARCSMLRPGGKGLDLGTGCGALALAAAPSAESVIGTDINGRSLGSNLKIQELSGRPPARTLYPNGQLQRETQYKMGLAHGWKEEWHPGGHIKQRTLYDLAVPIQEQEFYREGNLIRQSKIDPQKAISIGAWWRSERMRSIDLCEFLPDMVARIQKKIRKGEPCGLS